MPSTTPARTAAAPEYIGMFLGLCLASVPAAAQQAASDPDPVLLAEVVVTATRSAVDPFDVAASIDAVDVARDLRLGASPAELLTGVPGVVARDRRNYAQDTQISIRGFGARSTFGIRGVRLYTDGIPASQPDGQGQTSHFNLDAADRIEVLRGPFSALYGNASGGVIQLFTADGADPPETRLGLVAGSHGSVRGSANLSADAGDYDANIGYSYFRTDGARAHSQAQRHSLNAKVGMELANGARLELVGNVLAQPWTQDPLGLTREQFDQDPRQVASVAEEFNTRKQVAQGQLGATYELPVGANDRLRVMAYAGSRDITQFLSIPAGAQEAPRHAGGVVDLGNGYGGTELRWIHSGELGGRPFELSGGLVLDTLRQHRRGYENFVGDTLGVRGRLRRDEIDTVMSFDQYLQADLHLSDRWSALLGARHSRVRMEVDDRYIAEANPDDSGSVDYRATTPVAGLMFRASDALHLYASYGRGFETPTLAEAGYRADGEPGLALDLRPARSHNAELGAKWRGGPVQATLAAFHARTRDELAVATASGGRTTYQNIPRSRRRGVELSLDWRMAPSLRMALAYTYLDARVTEAFMGCSERCSAPTTPIAAGTRIAGVPRHDASLGLHWQPAQGWETALMLDHSGDVTVNDFASETAPAYTLLGAEVGRRWNLDGGDLRLFLRGDNLGDRDYVGSVIVNDGNGRYYEPGAGRSWMLGVQWRGKP